MPKARLQQTALEEEEPGVPTEPHMENCNGN